MQARRHRPRTGPAMTALRCVLASLAILIGAESGVAAGTDAVSREYEIKAAFIYNFALFVEWPESAFGDPADPFVIGVLGQDPFGDTLDEIARTKTIAGRPIVIRRFAALDDYTPCHMLFISESAQREIAAVVERCTGSPVLLVADTEGSAARGAAISFAIERNKVRFEINPVAAERAGLKISSKLLRLARIVKTEDP